MKKAIVTGLWSLLLATVLTVPAFAQELVVGGQVVGVQISTEGVVVAGFSEIETESGTASPAQSAGVHQGDLITAVNGSKVADAQEVISAVGESLPGAIPQTGNTNTKCRFSIPACRFVEKWCAAAPTHHLALGVGNHTEEIEIFARMADIPLTKVLED